MAEPLPIPEAAEPSIEELADRANRAHALVEQAATAMVLRAIEAGEALCEAKRLLGHGEWEDWLPENFAGSKRTARAYMRLYANRQRAAVLAAPSIRKALEAIAEPRPKPASGLRCADCGVAGPDLYRPRCWLPWMPLPPALAIYCRGCAGQREAALTAEERRWIAEVSERNQAAGVAGALLHVAGIRECVERLQREYPSVLPLAVRGAIEEALGLLRELAAGESPNVCHEPNAPAARKRPGADTGIGGSDAPSA